MARNRGNGNAAERELNPMPAEGMEGEAALDYVKNAAPEEALESSELALHDSDILDRLEAAMSAPDDAFIKGETDFYKPVKVGDKLRGIYLGKSRVSRYYVHAFATKGKDGKPMVKRVNGSTILTKELKQIPPKSGVELTFQGETKTQDGNKLTLWDVARLG